MTINLRVRESGGVWVAMLVAEVRESAHGDAVLLIEPGKFQPELALGRGDGDEPACGKYPQGDVAVGGQLAHQRLKLTQLF